MAVDYALDHAGLMNRAFGGGIPALGLLPPYSPWNYEESLSAPRDYSPDSARWLLENAGFTPPQIGAIVGLALGVNPILDMFETACNVTGDNSCTYIVAKIHKMLSPGGQETDPS